MRFQLEVGIEKCRIEFTRDCVTGHATVTIDGERITVKSGLSPFTHFSFHLTNRYEFQVGTKETHQVVIEHERPLLFAGFRPHKYRAFVDGSLAEEHRGY